MSEVKHFSITKTVDFYINEASPEIIAGRRIYLETVLIPRLRTGLAVLNKMGLTEREDMELRDVYQRGVAAGVFRPDVDPVDLHMSISALCFFNEANRHTFGAIFKRSLDTPAATAQRRESIIEMIVRFLRP